MITILRGLITGVKNVPKEIKSEPHTLSLYIYALLGLIFVPVGIYTSDPLLVWFGLGMLVFVSILLSIIHYLDVKLKRETDKFVQEYNLFNEGEVSRFIGVPESIVKRLAEDKILTGYKLGGDWYFLGEDIMSFRERANIQIIEVKEEE